MDDLEFRRRAFSNPLDDDGEFIHASQANPDRRQLIEELTHLEQRLHAGLKSVSVPSTLRDKLHSHALETPQPVASQPRNRAYMLAASLVITAGLAINVAVSRPSAQDLALHDALVEHLHHESPRYSGDSAIQWEQVIATLQAAGVTVKDDAAIAELHMTFANFCGLDGQQRGAHIVAKGEHGPVSIIVLRNAPVSAPVKLKDSRFKGHIVPVEGGNMAVVGEKNESLEYYEKIVRDNLQWSI